MEKDKQVVLSEEGKALLEFVKEVQSGKLSGFQVTLPDDKYSPAFIPSFDIKYQFWGRVV